jgi:hypothetical protein
MPHRSPRDSVRMLRAVTESYACRSPDDFPSTALVVCSRLIPNDLAGYTESDTAADDEVRVLGQRAPEPRSSRVRF